MFKGFASEKNTESLKVTRVEFKDGASLDGPLLTQTFTRLRNVESAVSNSPRNKYTFITYVDNSTTPMSTALNDVLVFTSPVTLSSSDLLTSPVNTIYRFGNLSNGQVKISNSNSVVLTIVPGEFVKLIKLPSQWFGTFGP
jgi:hypothetical protein